MINFGLRHRQKLENEEVPVCGREAERQTTQSGKARDARGRSTEARLDRWTDGLHSLLRRANQS